jgi:putative tryptophan/tyrosine transport system substrate-binding protein
MRRREFIALLGGGAAAAWPLAARAQQAVGLPRIGMLRFSKQDQAVIDSLLRGLQALGYVDGKNVAIEYRDAEGDYERFQTQSMNW